MVGLGSGSAFWHRHAVMGMAEEIESMSKSEPLDDESLVAESQSVLDRRAALRAALGGAAAAAVFVAPRVEGFSIAPDYAAAGTCRVDPSRSGVVGGSKVLVRCCSQDLTTLCYGGLGCASSCTGVIDCGTPNFNVPTVNGTLNIPLNNVAPVQNITLTYRVGGATREYITDWNNDSVVRASLSGLPANKSCTVNINGTCGAGTFSISNANHVTNNDSNRNEWGGYSASLTSVANQNSVVDGNGLPNGGWSTFSRRKVDCFGFENSFANANVAITIGLSCVC